MGLYSKHLLPRIVHFTCGMKLHMRQRARLVLPAEIETRRVLRGGGRLLFCEHGLAPDADVRKWQNRFNPLWKVLGGGCHLNRDIPTLLRAAGYKIDTMDTVYLPGWKPAAFNYWGVAT